jgi:type IV secretion system protein VirB4
VEDIRAAIELSGLLRAFFPALQGISFKGGLLMMSLERFQSQAPGLPDLMNYAALVDEGIVIGKDGSLLAGFFFQAPDAGSSSNSERNYLAAQVNNYLAKFGSGWCMWVDAARIPSPGYPDPEESHFPDPISAMIDAERRQMFEQQERHYETEYALFLQYLPPSRQETKLVELIYDDEKRDKENPGAAIIDDFKKKLTDFMDGLSKLMMIRRMGTIRVGEEGYESDELVNYLHFALMGEMIALRIPACPMYLDSWLGYEWLWKGEIPRLGDQFIACVAIDGFPAKSYPGMLRMLENLPIAYRWSSRFIFLDQHEALSALKRHFLKWSQWAKGFWQQLFKTDNGIVNTDAVAMSAQVVNASGVAKSDAVRYGYYTSVIVLMSKNRELLEENARYVRKTVNGLGFSSRVETVNTIEAWIGSLPAQAYANVRRPLIHSLNLAELLPLSSIWPGLLKNPCGFYPDNSPPLMYAITVGSTPFRINLHVTDVGHTLVFGPTGAGKSTLLAMLIAQALRYRGRTRPDGDRLPATITAFDKGHSLYALCKAVRGQHHDIGADDAQNMELCPLADIETQSGILWAEEWIETCYELQTGKPFAPSQRNEVRTALMIMKDRPVDSRSLTHFVSTVQDQSTKDAMEHYTVNGSMGHLLDGIEDRFSMSNFTVFELDELMALGDKNAIPVLLYLFRRFEKSLTGQPAFLFLDEAWVMLGHKVFRDKLRQWLKELRKKNCAVVMATQSLSDAVKSGMLDTLNEQCPTKIFLPNEEADLHGTSDHPGPAGFYASFGLNEQEIMLIKGGQKKRDYYYRSPLGRRSFQLGLGPLALSFVGVSDKDSINEVKDHEKKYGPDWPLYWMKRKGVDYAKYVS